MKKIYGLMMLAAAFSFASCSDDDNVGSQYLKENTVKVVSSNVHFTAKADTGSVVFDASAGATVRLNASWATAEIEGNKVKLAVASNPHLESRSSLLTIKSGSDSTNVTLVQQGMIYKSDGDVELVVDDKSQVVRIPVEAIGADLKFEATDSWAKASFDGKTINVALDENTTNQVRTVAITCTAKPYQDEIVIMQGERKDVVNRDYTFVAYDLMNAKSAYTLDSLQNKKFLNSIAVVKNCYLEDKDGVVSVKFLDDDLTLPVTFFDDELVFLLTGGQNLGTYYSYFNVFTAVYDPRYLAQFKASSLCHYVATKSFMMLGLQMGAANGSAYMITGYDEANNAAFQKLMGDNSYDYYGYILGLSAYSSAAVSANGFVKNIHEYYSPQLIESSLLVEDESAKSLQSKQAAFVQSQAKKANTPLKYILR